MESNGSSDAILGGSVPRSKSLIDRVLAIAAACGRLGLDAATLSRVRACTAEIATGKNVDLFLPALITALRKGNSTAKQYATELSAAQGVQATHIVAAQAIGIPQSAKQVVKQPQGIIQTCQVWGEELWPLAGSEGPQIAAGFHCGLHFVRCICAAAVGKHLGVIAGSLRRMTVPDVGNTPEDLHRLESILEPKLRGYIGEMMPTKIGIYHLAMCASERRHLSPQRARIRDILLRYPSVDIVSRTDASRWPCVVSGMEAMTIFDQMALGAAFSVLVGNGQIRR